MDENTFPTTPQRLSPFKQYATLKPEGKLEFPPKPIFQPAERVVGRKRPDNLRPEGLILFPPNLPYTPGKKRHPFLPSDDVADELMGEDLSSAAYGHAVRMQLNVVQHQNVSNQRRTIGRADEPPGSGGKPDGDEDESPLPDEDDGHPDEPRQNPHVDEEDAEASGISSSSEMPFRESTPTSEPNELPSHVPAPSPATISPAEPGNTTSPASQEPARDDDRWYSASRRRPRPLSSGRSPSYYRRLIRRWDEPPDGPDTPPRGDRFHYDNPYVPRNWPSMSADDWNRGLPSNPPPAEQDNYGWRPVMIRPQSREPTPRNFMVRYHHDRHSGGMMGSPPHDEGIDETITISIIKNEADLANNSPPSDDGNPHADDVELNDPDAPKEGWMSNDQETRPARLLTDKPWLGIFVLVMTLKVATLISCASMGSIGRMVNGYDRSGNVCGIKNSPIEGAINSGKDMTDFPYCVIGGTLNAVQAPCEQCVSKCPNGQTPENKRCGTSKDVAQHESEFLNQSVEKFDAFFKEIYHDAIKAWKELTYMALVAIGISVLITILLRFLPYWIIRIISGMATVWSFAATVALWVLWSKERTALEAMQRDASAAGTSSSAGVVRNKSQEVGSLLAGAIISTLLAVLVLIIIITKRRRMSMVVDIFKNAAKVLGAEPFLICLPLWNALALIGVVALWLLGGVLIETAGEPVVLLDGTVRFRLNWFFKTMRVKIVLTFFWLILCILACQHTTVAGATATWFYAREKVKTPLIPIIKSMYTALRYHMGSLALSSVLLPLVKALRYPLSKLQQVVEKARSSESCMNCCNCCKLCFEQYSMLQYIGTNAYTEIAQHGYGLFKAAKEAYDMLMSKGLQIPPISSICDFFFFFAETIVVLSVVFIGIEFIKMNENGVIHTWFPVALGAYLAYLISHVHLSLFAMAVDAVFLCACEDLERAESLDLHVKEFIVNHDDIVRSMMNHAAVKDVAKPSPAQEANKNDKISIIKALSEPRNAALFCFSCCWKKGTADTTGSYSHMQQEQVRKDAWNEEPESTRNEQPESTTTSSGFFVCMTACCQTTSQLLALLDQKDNDAGSDKEDSSSSSNTTMEFFTEVLGCCCQSQSADDGDK